MRRQSNSNELPISPATLLLPHWLVGIDDLRMGWDRIEFSLKMILISPSFLYDLEIIYGNIFAASAILLYLSIWRLPAFWLAWLMRVNPRDVDRLYFWGLGHVADYFAGDWRADYVVAPRVGPANDTKPGARYAQWPLYQGDRNSHREYAQIGVSSLVTLDFGYLCLMQFAILCWRWAVITPLMMVSAFSILTTSRLLSMDMVVSVHYCCRWLCNG